jgi:hypothetical protein
MGCYSLPPWNPVPTGQTSVYSKIETNESLISFITFGDNPDIVAIGVEYKIGRYAPRYALIADPPARTAIQEICNKYFDWQKLAIENRVDIMKEIRTITLPLIRRSGAGWEAGEDRELRFVFTSQVLKNNTPHTTLRVRSGSFLGGHDQFVLDDSQVQVFADSLKEGAVASGFQAARQKQEAIEKFN